MNKSVFPALLAITVVVISATGCVIRPDDHGGGPGGGGGGGGQLATVTAQWSFRNMLDGATTACPTGYDTVVLTVQAVDSTHQPIGAPAIDLFDCAARTGASTDLNPDLYQVWIDVRSHDRSALYAQSLSQFLDLRDADQPFATDILNDGGYFQLGWSLVGKSTNRPVSCAQVPGLTGLRAVSTLVAGPTRAYDDDLRCEDGATVSGGLLQGGYTIQIDARAGSTIVGSAPALTNQVIAGQNRVTDLGDITIPINGL